MTAPYNGTLNCQFGSGPIRKLAVAASCPTPLSCGCGAAPSNRTSTPVPRNLRMASSGVKYAVRPDRRTMKWIFSGICPRFSTKAGGTGTLEACPNVEEHADKTRSRCFTVLTPTPSTKPGGKFSRRDLYGTVHAPRVCQPLLTLPFDAYM